MTYCQILCHLWSSGFPNDSTIAMAISTLVPKKKPILTVLLRGWYTVAYHLVMTNIAMENHHRNRWFTYKKHGDGFRGYVSHNQRVFIQCYPLGVGKIWENGWNPEALRFFLRGHLTCLAVKKRAIRLGRGKPTNIRISPIEIIHQHDVTMKKTHLLTNETHQQLDRKHQSCFCG